jgi:hypothetical protein
MTARPSKTTKKPAPAKKPAPKKKAAAKPEPRGASPAKAGLGTKWSCFSCGRKFYDLNRPEPVCPACGADQRKKPKTSEGGTPAPPPAKRPSLRPMAPLLDDDETETFVDEEEVDVDLGDIDTGLFDEELEEEEEPFEEEE